MSSTNSSFLPLYDGPFTTAAQLSGTKPFYIISKLNILLTVSSSFIYSYLIFISFSTHFHSVLLTRSSKIITHFSPTETIHIDLNSLLPILLHIISAILIFLVSSNNCPPFHPSPYFLSSKTNFRFQGAYLFAHFYSYLFIYYS